MTCQHCVTAVFTALTPVEGITSADVDVGSVTVEHDGRVTVDALRDAIAVAGYDAVLLGEERRQLPIV
jgi:copper chaperone CopZ